MKSKIYLSIFTTLLLLGSSCIQWDLDKVDFFTSVLQLNTNQPLGYSLNNGFYQHGNGDYYYTGTTADGKILVGHTDEKLEILDEWTKYGNGNAQAIISKFDADDTFIVLANTEDDIWALTLDTAGTLISVDSFLNQSMQGLETRIQAYDILSMEEEGYIIAGTIEQSIGAPRFVLIRTDTTLKALQFGFYNGNDKLVGSQIGKLPSGEIVYAGYYSDTGMSSFTKAGTDFYADWEVLMDNTALASAQFIFEPSTENIYALATIQANNSSSAYLKKISIEEEGIIKEWKLDDMEIGRTLLISREGGIVVVGTNNHVDGAGNTISIQQIDSDGNVMWKNEIAGLGKNEIPKSVIQAKDYGFSIFTLIQSGNESVFDARILKTDEEGAVR